MRVIGTAGHIDHGKSALVRRLTGIDPDRLEEEKRRGMTIDLGFAWLTLPSGTEVSVVDVPGHERFVKNMLAGAAGIDVALLVVAADEGIMPQTREHLDILDLLGVRSGVAAVTKIDLVDREWRQLVVEEVADTVSRTTLGGSPIVPVSSMTGEGIDELLKALDRSVQSAAAPIQSGVAYLPVDRVFTVAGFGTVVTGTLHNGGLQVGQEIEAVPSGRRARIRNLQTHRRQVTQALPGTRVAVNVVGLSKEEVGRGDVLALPGMVRPVGRLDAWLRVLDDAPFPLSRGMEVMVHIGSAERVATLSLIERWTLGPGEASWAQLRFFEPVAAVRGQRFIVRLPAPARTVGGGDVVDIAPQRRRTNASRSKQLAALRSASLSAALEAMLPVDRPRSAAQLATRLSVDPLDAEGVLRELKSRGVAVQLGPGYLSSSGWEKAVEQVVSILRAYHQAFPMRRGMPREEIRSKLKWTSAHWAGALERLVEAGVVREIGPLLALPVHRGGTSTRRGEVERVLDLLQRQPFSPPSGSELLAAAATEVMLLEAMADERLIVRVAAGLYFARDAYDRMVEQVLHLIVAGGQVTVAQVRDELDTSRKYALALLEHLDAEHITRRVGDVRVLGSKAS